MFDLLKFITFLFFFVFLPGRFIFHLSKVKLPSVETVLLSSALGILVLTFTSWILGHLRVDFLTFPILLLIDFYLIFGLRWRPEIPSFHKKHLLPLVVILIGATFHGLLMFKSGTFYQGGIAFWGVHGYDGIWHAALIQELSNHFPPQNPGFAGEALKNYHFLTDLFIAQIHKVTRIPILDLYFRFCPAFFVVLLNSLVFLFAKKWSGKTSIACWSVFFVSVAGSFGWVPQLFGKGSNNWETAFWGIQPTTSFLNPPFGVSLILLVLGLVLLEIYLKKRTRSLILIISFVFGLLVGFKIYAGIIVLGALGVLGASRALRGKRDLLFIFILSVLLALVIYLPTSSGSTNFLVWQPWWFIKTMVEAPDRLNWPSLELRRQVYVAYNDWISLFFLQTIAFFIFLVGNLGTRVIGFITAAKKIFKGLLIDRFLLFIALIAFLPPIFFTQKAVLWNSIQFFYYFTFVFSFFAAESVVLIISKFKIKILKIIFGVLIIAFALPSTIKTIYWFNAPTPTTLLDQKEVEALKFLKEKSKIDDILLTYPYGEGQAKNFPKPPVPMTHYNSQYVSFFSERRVFLEDQNTATILGYDLEKRLKQVKNFFLTDNMTVAKDFLIQNKISYVYLVDDQDLIADKEAAGLVKIFDNQKVRIYRFNGKI